MFEFGGKVMFQSATFSPRRSRTGFDCVGTRIPNKPPNAGGEKKPSAPTSCGQLSDEGRNLIMASRERRPSPYESLFRISTDGRTGHPCKVSPTSCRRAGLIAAPAPC